MLAFSLAQEALFFIHDRILESVGGGGEEEDKFGGGFRGEGSRVCWGNEGKLLSR